MRRRVASPDMGHWGTSTPPCSLRMHENFADLTPDGFHFWMTLSPRPVRHAPVPPGAKFWRRHCLAQQQVTLSDLERPFHASRAIFAVAELLVILARKHIASKYTQYARK